MAGGLEAELQVAKGEALAHAGEGEWVEAVGSTVRALRLALELHGGGTHQALAERKEAIQFLLGVGRAQLLEHGNDGWGWSLLSEAGELAAGHADLEVQVLLRRGDCLRQAGRELQALRVLEDALRLQLDPDGGATPSDAVAAEIHLVLGAVLSEAGSHTDALHQAQRAVLLTQSVLHRVLCGQPEQDPPSGVASTRKGGARGLASVVWVVRVRTADVKGGGTDAQVSIMLTGTRGCTGPLLLVNPDPLTAFEPGQNDDFEVEAHDVGDVHELLLSHDGSGFSADWCVEELILCRRWNRGGSTNEDDTAVHFPCGGWLRGEKKGAPASVELLPVVEPSTAARQAFVRAARAEALSASLATAYHNAGVELETLGRSAAAQESYAQAAALASSLGEGHPTGRALTESYRGLPFGPPAHAEAHDCEDSDDEPESAAALAARRQAQRRARPPIDPHSIDRFLQLDPAQAYSKRPLELMGVGSHQKGTSARSGGAPDVMGRGEVSESAPHVVAPTHAAGQAIAPEDLLELYSQHPCHGTSTRASPPPPPPPAGGGGVGPSTAPPIGSQWVQAPRHGDPMPAQPGHDRTSVDTITLPQPGSVDASTALDEEIHALDEEIHAHEMPDVERAAEFEPKEPDAEPEPEPESESRILTDASLFVDVLVDRAIDGAVASASAKQHHGAADDDGVSAAGELRYADRRRARGLDPAFFARWDTDGNGILDRGEVAVMLAALRAEALGEEEDTPWCVIVNPRILPPCATGERC
jgi:tetratricopeptide (TPR) repeat protein